MFKFNIYLTTLLLVAFSGATFGTTCRSLTFSGSGAFGAYQAGVFKGLHDKYNGTIQWPIVSGVSAGSINAAGVAMYNIGDEEAAAEFLINRWTSISPQDIYVDWSGGILDGIIFQRGAFNTAPLYELLTQSINATMLRSSNRQLFFGATNLDTGLFDQFGKGETDLARAVQASCSIPGIFPPTEMNGYSYADGGVTYMTPTTDAARLCYETGASQVIVDMVTVEKNDLQTNTSDEKTIDVLLRTAQILLQNFNNGDIQTLFQAYPNTILNIYRPSQKLPGNALSFTFSKELIQMGYQDAQNENNVVQLTKHNYKDMLLKLNYK